MSAEVTDPEIQERSVPYMVGTEASPLEPLIIEALCSVYDPEIPVSVFELGLIYDMQISDEGVVKVVMTLTAPNCPVAEEIPLWVKNAIKGIKGVLDVEVEIVWEPFWRPEYMTEAARLQLGLM